MRFSSVVLPALLVVAMMSASDGYLCLGTFALGGLSVAEGAAFYHFWGNSDPIISTKRKYRGPHQRRNRRRHGRAIHNVYKERKNSLSSVDNHDSCILKMLCHLQTSVGVGRSQESALVNWLASTPEIYSTAIMPGMDIGAKTQSAIDCDTISKCSLSEAQVSGLLQEVLERR
ncbi:uncharacterized protein [Procambarus clarkii]|uniref:uncharacterized protein n=1 Tax=Procambarus clarkii TaxID=6728 RepID=UPI003743E4E5